MQIEADQLVCPACGSRLDLSPGFHHMMCAYVGPEYDFVPTADGYDCPKCRRSIVSGDPSLRDHGNERAVQPMSQGNGGLAAKQCAIVIPSGDQSEAVGSSAAAQGSGVSASASVLEPPPGETGPAKTCQNRGTAAHDIPKQTCPVVFDHEHDRTLIDAEVIWRNPPPCRIVRDLE